MKTGSTQSTSAGKFTPIIHAILVDDERPYHGILPEFARRQPGVVCHPGCFSGAEALAKIPGLGIDLVFMDVRLGEMTGIECLKELKKLSPGIAVILISAFPPDDNVLRAVEAGARGFLEKSVVIKELGPALEAYREGRTWLSRGAESALFASLAMEATKREVRSLMTNKEWIILELLLLDGDRKTMPDTLGIKPSTLKTHCRNIYHKLGVRSLRALKVRLNWQQGGKV